MKMGKKILSIMFCLGLLFAVWASDAGDDIGKIPDGNTLVVSENAGEAQTELSEINVATADEFEVEGSAVNSSGLEETQNQNTAEILIQNEAYKLFYGTWEITQVVAARRWPEDPDIFGNADYDQDILGMQFTYGPDVFKSGDDVWVENPNYQISIFPTDTWMDHFTAPSCLVPEENYFVRVDILTCSNDMGIGNFYGYAYEPYVGSSFYIKDDNTLYYDADGFIYEMKRVGWFGDDPEDEEENVTNEEEIVANEEAIAANEEEVATNEEERIIVRTQNEVYKMFYGTWEIRSVVSRSRRWEGVEGYGDLIGTEVTYGPKEYCIGNEIVVNNPLYQMFVMPMSPAVLSDQERNLYSLLPESAYYVWVEIANLPADNENRETSGTDPYVGSTFFLKDDNTMYCINNNCIYEMTRRKGLGDEFGIYYGWGWNIFETGLSDSQSPHITQETGELPKWIWSESFFSGGKQYTAVYYRISSMYENQDLEDSSPVADYRFAILRGDDVCYEINLYGMSMELEEEHYREDVNGDGIKDFIQLSNSGCNKWNVVPYVFVWEPEQETCISGGLIVPEDRENNSIYESVLYDRDTGIFYEASVTERNALNGQDIHDLVIVRGAKYVDGEWRTVYEMYLGKESENYARETRYDEEGNIISETLYSGDEPYDVINKIYLECEVSLNTDYIITYWR